MLAKLADLSGRAAWGNSAAARWASRTPSLPSLSTDSTGAVAVSMFGAGLLGGVEPQQVAICW